jgi:NTP pyrophosphatase (non-canonical NTP hydrolase)
MRQDQKDCIEEILKERERQNKKWGAQTHEPEIWLAILSEEVGELSEAILHSKFGGKEAGRTREELIHVAAVALQMLEAGL